MPGLAGIISKQSSEISKQQLVVMLASMQHEKFYVSDTYEDQIMSVYVGLTSHDRSTNDFFPVTNQAKNIILFFSGDIFHEHEQGFSENRLGANTYLRKFIDLYEKNGEECFEKLNGWFCGLILDILKKKIYLFNDRYGMHRVFIHEKKDGLYFSSEAKALLSVIPESRYFDPVGIGEFLSCGCTLGRHSLYREISVMPSASLWTFVNGEVKTKSIYFDPINWIKQQRFNEKEFLPQFVESFGRLTKRYIVAPSPVGISLTGGLDSRMIMACLKTKTEQFPCYTFGSMYRDTFDVKLARKVAESCGQPFTELTLGEEFIQEFPYWLEKAVYISDGYLGFSGAAELYMNKLARGISPVRLTGNYGSELLRGVRAFKCISPNGDCIKSEMQAFLIKAEKSFKRLEANDPLTFALFCQAPSQGYGCLSIERSQLQLRTPFMDNDMAKLMYKAPSSLLKSNDLTEAIIRNYNPNLLNIPTDRGLLGTGSHLRKLLRQAHREALFKAEYWSSHGMPGWLVLLSRGGLGRFLEKAFIGRHKFQHFLLWTQRVLSHYLFETLIQGVGGLNEYFNVRKVERMLQDHVNRINNYTDEIDKLLTITLVHQCLLRDAGMKYDSRKESGLNGNI